MTITQFPTPANDFARHEAEALALTKPEQPPAQVIQLADRRRR